MNDTDQDTRATSARIRARITPAARALIDQLPTDPDTATDDELTRGIELGEQAWRRQRESLPTNPGEAIAADPEHTMTWIARGVGYLRSVHRGRVSP